MIYTNKKNKINIIIVKVSLLVLFILFVSLNTGICRMRETPKSFTVKCKSLNCIHEVTTGSIPQLNQILRNNPDLKIEYRYGTPWVHKESINLGAAWNARENGTWESLPDGSQLWRFRIYAIDAKLLSLEINHFSIPEGAKLWIYNFSRKYVEGPYIDQDIINYKLWTAMIPGEKIVVELYCPAETLKEKIVLNINTVHYLKNYDYLHCHKKRSGCNIDVACPGAEKWCNQIRSVAFYTIKGRPACSGVLLNNTRGDLTPYFLTAGHCVSNEDDAQSMVFYWNFQSPECTKCGDCIAPGNLKDNQTGAFLLAKWTDEKGSDFALLKLKKKPDPDFNVYYSGWDASGETPESVVGIHHPQGYEKAICFSGGKIRSVNNNKKFTFTKEIYWYIQKWERGTTESKSSGSGLWDTCSGLCIGQLHKPPVGCNKCKPSNIAAYYGKLSASWEGGGTPFTRLKDWLDPLYIFECTGEPPKLIGIDAPTLRTIKQNLLKAIKIIIEIRSGKLNSLAYLINSFNQV